MGLMSFNNTRIRVAKGSLIKKNKLSMKFILEQMQVKLFLQM